MVQKAANIRFHASALPVEPSCPAGSCPVGMSRLFVSSLLGGWKWGLQAAFFFLIAIAPHVAYASCGDYLQHRDQLISGSGGPSHDDSSESESSCRSGQCRSRSNVPMLPSEFLTKWNRMRDLLESTWFGKEVVLSADPFGVFWKDGMFPSSALLEVPVPPPRGTVS